MPLNSLCTHSNGCYSADHIKNTHTDHIRHTLTTEDTPTKPSRHAPELTMHTHSPIAVSYSAHHTDYIRHTLTRLYSY